MTEFHHIEMVDNLTDRYTVKSPESHLARSHVARNLSHVARNFSYVARKKKSSRPKKQILQRSEFQTVNRQ